MPRSRHTFFQSIPLTYSSPSSQEAPAPSLAENFYNAFPELNDVAGDNTLSLIPVRAKYNLPLDGELLPYGREIAAGDDDLADTLASVNPFTAEQLRVVFARDPHATMAIEKGAALADICDLHIEFELAHKRLSATPWKSWFRRAKLAPFYSILEHTLVARRPIVTPLIADHRGTKLERQWATITEGFLSTQAIEEATSLLVGVILAEIDDVYAHEKRWVAEQRAEVPGFGMVYDNWRARFRREDCRDGAQRRALAEAVIAHAKAALTQMAPRIPEQPVTRPSSRPGGRYQQLILPDLVAFNGPRHFQVERSLLSGGSTRPSIPEAVQCVLAQDVMRSDRDKSYAHEHDTWLDYADFSLDQDEHGAFIKGGLNRACFDAITAGIAQRGGASLHDDSVRCIADYSVLLEALRQQICTGVGLCCPFWDGSTCCDLRAVVQLAYQVTQPGEGRWKAHWQQPPCLR